MVIARGSPERGEPAGRAERAVRPPELVEAARSAGPPSVGEGARLALSARPLLIAFFFALVALLAAAPVMWPGTALAAVARVVFSGLCHQQVARSFAVDEHTFAVCHRCAGIYAGLSLGPFGALVLAVDPTRWRHWIAGGAPLAVQVVLGWISPSLDLWWLRAATGLWAGLFAGLLLARALVTPPRYRAATPRADAT